MLGARLSRALDRPRVLAGAVLAPTLALVVLFGHIPALSSLRLAFSRYNIKQPARRGFVGLDNFVHVLTDDAFHAALGRVAYFMAAAIVAVLAIGLVFALVLNRDFRGRALLRTVIIIPWAIPPVVSGHAWRWIFNGEYGALNGLLWQAGIIGEYRFWLTEPLTALSAAVLVFVWRFVPFVAVLFLGALQTIPAELYESAAVDGAGPVRRFRHVTVPAVTAIAAIALVLTGITAFNVFDEIYALTGPQEITRTPMIYNYETTFVRGRFGRGAAMAYLSGLVLFALSIVYMRLALRERDV